MTYMSRGIITAVGTRTAYVRTDKPTYTLIAIAPYTAEGGRQSNKANECV